MVENDWKAGEVEDYKQRSRRLFPVFSLVMDVQTGVYDLSRYVTPPPEPVMKHRLQWHGAPSPWKASNGDRPVVAASNPCRCCSIGRSVIKTIRTEYSTIDALQESRDCSDDAMGRGRGEVAPDVVSAWSSRGQRGPSLSVSHNSAVRSIHGTDGLSPPDSAGMRMLLAVAREVR